jgi:tRNA (guanosine-2'-O-)-methyltransferase
VDASELISHLEQFITPQRKARLLAVLEERTSHIRVVLEDIFQEHNASAVLRSCDCFGVQHVHFIEKRNVMRVNDEVAMGSSQWLNIHRHKQADSSTANVLAGLRDEGYEIVAVTPHSEDFTPATLPLDRKFALVFGTEMEGLSKEALGMADKHLRIPMYGFTESFNISVCAALCMYELTTRLRGSGIPYRLTQAESAEVYRRWLVSSIEMGEAIEADYLKNKK